MDHVRFADFCSGYIFAIGLLFRVHWAIVCFVIMHVYVAIRDDIMSRQSLISTMVSGWRMFNDSRPLEDSL